MFAPNWLPYAIPFDNGKFDDCHYFDRKRGIDLSNAACSPDAFNKSKIESCATDEIIYGTDEISIVNEVTFFCFTSELIIKNVL